jgi:hypothetical protein
MIDIPVQMLFDEIEEDYWFEEYNVRESKGDRYNKQEHELDFGDE